MTTLPKDKNQRGSKDRAKYITWVENTCLSSKYGNDFPSQLYDLRCAVLHEGTYYSDASSSIPRLMVVARNPNLIMHDCNIIMPSGNVIVYGAPTLCNDIIQVVKNWEDSIKNNPVIKQNLEQIVHLHPNGIPPYIVGVPVIG